MANNTTMILSARGAFYQVSLADASSASKSIYAVNHLTINPDTTTPKSPILIDGIRTRESDIVSRTPCLNNFKVYYSFGQNFGDISVIGQVLLGPMGDVETDGVKRLRDFFAKYRVSVYQDAIEVNLLDKSYFMYLEGLQIMEVDKEFHILPFMLSGTQLDLSRTPPSNINPNTVILSDVNLDDSSLAKALSVTSPAIAAATTNSTTALGSTNVDSPDSIGPKETYRPPEYQSPPAPASTLSGPPTLSGPNGLIGPTSNTDATKAYNATNPTIKASPNINSPLNYNRNE